MISGARVALAPTGFLVLRTVDGASGAADECFATARSFSFPRAAEDCIPPRIRKPSTHEADVIRRAPASMGHLGPRRTAGGNICVPRCCARTDQIDINFLAGNRLERVARVSAMRLPMGRYRDGDSSWTERHDLDTSSVTPS